MLSCIGSGLATGLIPRPRCPTDYEDPEFQINSGGNRKDVLIRENIRRNYYKK
jgi:hypothetical protein